MAKQFCKIHCLDSPNDSLNLIKLTEVRKQTVVKFIAQYINYSLEPFRAISAQNKHFIDIIPTATTSSAASVEFDIHCHEGCYKKFTHKRHLEQAKKRKMDSETEMPSDGDMEETSFSGPRPKRQAATPVLPALCVICKEDRKRVTRRGKRIYESLCLTRDVNAGKLIQAAEQKMDEEILREVRGSDAVARELRYHPSCYQRYCKTPREPEVVQKAGASSGYKKFEEMVVTRIIDGNEVLKYTLLYKLYQEVMQGFPAQRILRPHRLKDKLKESIPSLKFSTSKNKKLSQVVYSEDVDLDVSQILSEPNAMSTTEGESSDSDLDISRGLQSTSIRRELYHVGRTIRKDLENHLPSEEDRKWPPDLEEFTIEGCERYVPPDLFNLLALITGHVDELPESNQYARTSDKSRRKILSIGQDIVGLWSDGRTLTPKALALGMTLRHYSGSKAVSNLVAGFGHSSGYHTMLKMETAMALQQKETTIPQGFSTKAMTTLVWDNIDFNEETISGAGTTHFVNGIMVQQPNVPEVDEQPEIAIPQSVSKSVRTMPECAKNIVHVNKPKVRTGPPTLISINSNSESPPLSLTDMAYVTIKHVHHNPSTIPNWTDFNKVLAQANFEPSPKSVIHYLPLIEAPATEISTINTILSRSLEIADLLKLDKIVLVFDQAIYAKIQELRWANPTYHERTIVRLGEFHTILSFLTILGKRFGDAGLSDILVESGIVASGSINAVLNGRHYNRAIRGHKILFEALSRLRLQDFLGSCDLERQTSYFQLADELSTSYRDPNFIATCSEQLTQFISEFNIHIEEKIAKYPTYRFWSSYIDMLQLLLNFVRATRISNWELHLSTVDAMLPWYFAYDRTNYSRFLPVYLTEMRNLSHEETAQMKKFFTVHRTKHSFTGTAMDQTIEQTINRQCKSSGGIGGVTLNPGSIQRWTLSQPSKAALSELCETMAGITSPDESTLTTESNGRKHEEMVQAVIDTISTMTNPFGEITDLLSVSSGVIASQDIESDITSAREQGTKEYNSFLNQRLASKDVCLFQPISKLKLKDFGSKSKKGVAKKSVVVQDRALFSRLLVVGQVRSLDIPKILTYSLSSQPLSLSTADGSLTKCNKAMLLHDLEDKSEKPRMDTSSLPDDGRTTAVVIDAMALIQALAVREFPKTFEDFAEVVWQRILSVASKHSAQRVDFVGDQYREMSIKNVERCRRAGPSGAQRVKIGSGAQKTPKQWKKYLSHPDNKRELQAYLYSEFKSRELESLLVYVTDDRYCCQLSRRSPATTSNVIPELESTHEEADTRLLLHLNHASKEGFGRIVIASPDTDVAVIALAVISEHGFQSRVGFATGRGNMQRVVDLSQMKEVLGTSLATSLPFFHAFTGCDSVSAFFGKGKKKALTILLNNPEIQEVFTLVPKDFKAQSCHLSSIERFVCQLYGSKSDTCDKARYELFASGTPASSLPPNQDSLKLHISRATYQAAVWMTATTPQPNVPPPDGHGWSLSDGSLRVVWRTKEIAPPEVLKTVYCRCTKGCLQGRCSCRSNTLPCTDLCGCNECENKDDDRGAEGSDTDDEASN